LLAANAVVIGGGAGTAPSTTTTGTGVLTALGDAVNASGGIVSPTPAAAGDIIYWNGTTWVKLAGNASGTNFLSETSAGVPSWAAGTSAGVSSFSSTCPVISGSTGAVTLTNGANVLAKSTAYTATTAECGAVYEVTGTTTITMPTIASGLEYTVINQNAPGGATVTVAADAGHTIGNNSAASITLSPGQSVGIAAGSGGTPTNWDLGPGQGSPTVDGPGYQTGVWYTAFWQFYAATNSPASVTTTYCSPGWIHNINPAGGGSGTINALGLRITTLGTSNVQLALYSNDTTVSPMRPGSLLGNTASIADTATGGFSATFTGVSVTPGTYWFCIQANDTTVRWSAVSGQNGQLFIPSAIGSTSIINALGGGDSGVGTAGTFGTWPASLHGSTWAEQANFSPSLVFEFTSIP
jgi:hypothetical protein